MAVVTANASSLDALADKLEEAASAVSARFAQAMVETGTQAALAAKARVRADRVKVRCDVIGPVVRVSTSGLGAIMENDGKGHVRHPTFGHEPWTSKNSRPEFMRAGLRAAELASRSKFHAAIAEGFAGSGL